MVKLKKAVRKATSKRPAKAKKAILKVEPTPEVPPEVTPEVTPEVPPAEPTPEEEAKILNKGDLPDPEISLPDQHSLVMGGGPIIHGVTYPFGFSVSSEGDKVKGNEKDYGVGNGVSAHSEGGGMTVYKIIYD
jgi:hypothetical protein